ncbi:chromodomain helicase hrp1 isoform X1 [Helianthus annuus]|uniref:chromodomain helicase hrp1 isoform X1 n=1 Tax=Helianthus annuus TaxID=4232 RepID=UPI001652C377|nr:chromodomain helicase hrp1 isoform X1 [Helianthus annuus]
MPTWVHDRRNKHVTVPRCLPKEVKLLKYIIVFFLIITSFMIIGTKVKMLFCLTGRLKSWPIFSLNDNPFLNEQKIKYMFKHFSTFYFINGMLQDRLLKVISFVSSLLDNMKKPILIIASSSARLLWESEFSKWSKSINVVTYKGTKDIRAAIRGSEFQVLLSSPDAIVEDMETLVHIKWELLVIDECQHPVISMHLKTIQMLMADMKLLTIFGEPVDVFQISLVDCKNEKIQSDADMEMNDDISTLKERLSPFIAFDCKFSTPDLKEYWVPVHLSSTQDRHDTLNLNQTELNRKSTPKDTSTVKVLQIPASTLVQPNNPYMINGPTTGPLRFQAPHLRSSPSSFASFRNQPTSSEPEPSLEPLPSLSATQTVDKHDHV